MSKIIILLHLLSRSLSTAISALFNLPRNFSNSIAIRLLVSLLIIAKKLHWQHNYIGVIPVGRVTVQGAALTDSSMIGLSYTHIRPITDRPITQCLSLIGQIAVLTERQNETGSAWQWHFSTTTSRPNDQFGSQSDSTLLKTEASSSALVSAEAAKENQKFWLVI